MFIPCVIFGSEKYLNIYLFYGDGCPHCAEEEEWFKTYLEKNKNIKIHRYEVWYDKDNQEKYSKVHEILNDKSSGIPYLVIGESVISGFDKDLTPERIRNAVEYYSNVNYKDKVGMYLGVVSESETGQDETKYEDTKVKIPLLGTKEAKDVSIGLSAILIGAVDGFNPCAMWILLFLISMLLGMKNKKRMWILGITFLASSALVYFLFLLSWLNLSIFLNKVLYIRVAISFFAVLFGVLQVVNFFFKKDDGCEVVGNKNRKRIIKSIQKIIKEKSFILAILGIILLAASVNIIELLCSLGLPVMFTQILAINEVSKVGQILYSLLYVLFFMIDDIIIFIIAMKTLEIKAISNKYGKYSHLIGGLIMIIIGVLMVYKPEWLMFNF
jgi:glutaredoxin